MNFQRETLFDVIEEVQPLLDAHYLELAKNRDRVRLNPDWTRYTEMEAAGTLLLFTARKDGRLIGYACFFACAHPHYRDLMLVSNDLLFLDAEHRVGRTGVRLIKFCEEQVRALYASEVSLTWHAKENTTLAAILPRMSYGIQDIVFSKLL
jgi:GNAT superfamily N-acetyltransferase